MNPLWNNSCEVPGCTYATACNYVATANTDDSSCEWESCVVVGCTYSGALNFNEMATVDDGSCQYSNCATDLDGDGAVATSDLLIFLVDFGTQCF